MKLKLSILFKLDNFSSHADNFKGDLLRNVEHFYTNVYFHRFAKYPQKIMKTLFLFGTEVQHHWPGVGLFLQNVFIFLGSLTYKFGRSEDQWG